MRFYAKGKGCESDLILEDMPPCTGNHYATELTKCEIHQLTGIPNKYGATFYRSCYRDVRKCSDWKGFCASIQWFCKSIQFPTYSDCPEQILTELGGNLPAVILQRRWSHTANRLAETSILATGTATSIKRLHERLTFEASFTLKRKEQVEQENDILRVQCKRLSFAYKTMVESKQCVSMLPKELQIHQRAWEKQLECLRDTISKSGINSNQSIAALTELIKGERADSGNAYAPKHAYPSLENLVACRWLLENLPASSEKHGGFGSAWRSFWQLQWSQYEISANPGKHPLKTLKGDEKYNRVGKNLYGTLSNMLHGYGHLCNIPVHPDVQTTIKAVGPIHYNKNKQIDLAAEKKRWVNLG